MPGDEGAGAGAGAGDGTAVAHGVTVYARRIEADVALATLAYVQGQGADWIVAIHAADDIRMLATADFPGEPLDPREVAVGVVDGLRSRLLSGSQVMASRGWEAVPALVPMIWPVPAG